ncbi:MAG TPA: Uma2 family endonuclease, partial [Pyrinomonadaceae bacterium]|nr:Uma2 family endonuclease [Pyrinomonadaceae bacterium]
MSAQPEKRYFNVDEYYRMARAGVLTPDDRVELIEGEIVKMSPIGSPHAACVSRLNSLLQSILGENAIVSVQNPVRLNDFSEPVPDVTLLKPQKDFYSSGHPGS